MIVLSTDWGSGTSRWRSERSWMLGMIVLSRISSPVLGDVSCSRSHCSMAARSYLRHMHIQIHSHMQVRKHIEMQM